jgi:hypothetical protein
LADDPESEIEKQEQNKSRMSCFEINYKKDDAPFHYASILSDSNQMHQQQIQQSLNVLHLPVIHQPQYYLHQQQQQQIPNSSSFQACSAVEVESLLGNFAGTLDETNFYETTSNNQTQYVTSNGMVVQSLVANTSSNLNLAQIDQQQQQQLQQTYSYVRLNNYDQSNLILPCDNQIQQSNIYLLSNSNTNMYLDNNQQQPLNSRKRKFTDSDLELSSKNLKKLKKEKSESFDCLVCGDNSSGYHYGAHVCEACKLFFRYKI